MEQNNVSVPVTPVAPVEKKSNGMLIAIIICAILAAGGIGFGVWAMMDGNNQVAKRDEQIANLNRQLAEKNQTVVEDDVEVDIGMGLAYKNPVIKSDNSEVFYSLGFDSSYILGEEKVAISIMNGRVSVCKKMERITDFSWRDVGECSIDGLNGNIYKIVEFGEGQDNSGDMIGFIMESGKVAYLKLYDFASSDSVAIKGYLNIDSVVTDALEIGVGSGVAGGYGSTVFVFSDGSFVKYDSSMLE